MRKGIWRLVIVMALVLTVAAPVPASAATDYFTDDNGNIHEANINTIAELGITLGCGVGIYCPAAPVTRAQMASFLARAANLPAVFVDYFGDDNGNVHEANINKIAAVGVTKGCGVGIYCPAQNVTREQMASFIARLLGLGAGPDRFTDDTGSVHEADINKIAAAGITIGCDDTGTKFCPKDPVRRDEMASFLARAVAYGLNRYPSVSITSPTNLATFQTTWNGTFYVATVTLSATVSDPDGDATTVQWFSSVQGAGLTGATVTATLAIPAGQSSSQPIITATATDSKGAKSSASIQLKLIIGSP
ncbi:MAG: hypothetical protein OEM81_09970 [Acidimicrobiia bacterium]|nr:hypothetical protein [Acidimicrobiia bacterium]